MVETKLVIIYPYPTDVDVFEKAYVEDHIPMATERIKGITKFVATKVVGTPDGQKPAFYRIAELHFSSREALKESTSSAGAQEAGMAGFADARQGTE